MILSASIKQIQNTNVRNSFKNGKKTFYKTLAAQALLFSTSTMDATKSVMDTHAKDCLTLGKIEKAAKRLEGAIHRTPIMTCSYLDKLAGEGRKLFFKCENFQKTGSFKV